MFQIIRSNRPEREYDIFSMGWPYSEKGSRKHSVTPNYGSLSCEIGMAITQWQILTVSAHV